MYKITTPKRLYLVGKMHELLDLLDIISKDFKYLRDYLEHQKT